MKKIFFIILISFFLVGCQKNKIKPEFPTIETRPPQYIWICNQHADGITVCDAVPTLEKIPTGYKCIYQDNSITVCWPEEKNKKETQ